MESELVPYIPHDILVGILSRLPVISLLRFRCVCKRWYSLISDTQFVTLHLDQSSKQSEKILLSPTMHWSLMHFDSIDSKSFYNQQSMERFEFPPEIRGSSESAVGFGSCNGLVLLVGCHENLILWNPSTRECREISYPHSTKYVYNTRIYGLGYDSINDDYKLGVVIFTDGEHRSYVISVFSLKTNRWKKRVTNCPYWPCETDPEMAATVVNGALHWVMVDYDNGESYKIVGFDLATESLKEMALPTYLESWDNDGDYFLGVLGGCLCLVGGVCNSVSKSVNVFVMKEYGVEESWMNLINFTYEEDSPWMGPIAFTSSGDILVELERENKLLTVNSETKEIKEISMDTKKHTILFAHVESLVSVYGSSNNGVSRRRLRRKRKILE